MITQRPGATIAAVIFLLMALVHAYRLAAPFEIVIGLCRLPQWASIIGVNVAGGLSLMLFREAKR